MKTNQATTLIALAAAFFLCTPPVFAGSSGGHSGGWEKNDLKSKFFHKTAFILHHSEAMGLSEEQKAGIENLEYEVKKEMIQRQAAIEVLELEEKRLLMNRVINTEEADKLIDQKYDLKKQKAKYLMGAMAKLKQSLNDDQYEKMKQLYEGMNPQSGEMKKH